MSLSELIRLTGSKTADPIGKAVVYLNIEGYLKFESGGPYLDSDPLIEITPKGTSARMADYFLRINHDIALRRVIDFSLVACNAVIATAAIFALNAAKNDDRLKAIEVRITKVEQAMKQMQSPPHTTNHHNTDSTGASKKK